MSYTSLTEKEPDAVKREWYERVELELGAEPTLHAATSLIPNVELARKRSDITSAARPVRQSWRSAFKRMAHGYC